MERELSPWRKSVKHALIDRDMQIVDLADALGMTRVHVSQVINGKVKSKAAVKKISDYLNIPDSDAKAPY